MALKELEVIAHAIACRGRGIPYYRCQLPTSITCRVKWPLRATRIERVLNKFCTRFERIIQTFLTLVEIIEVTKSLLYMEFEDNENIFFITYLQV